MPLVYWNRLAAALLMTALCCIWASPSLACPQGRVLYDQAMQCADPALRADLLRRSVEVCPSFLAYYKLGLTCLESGDVARAGKAAAEAHELAGDSEQTALALALRGYVSEREGKPRQALSFFRASYGARAHSQVLEAMKALETEMMGRDVQASEIRDTLACRGFRTFGVRPSIDLHIHFAYDSAQLTPKGRELTARLGEAMMDPQLTREKFLIMGHTDSRGGDQYNLGLSRDRASTVRATLEAAHPGLRGRLATEGMGERELLYPGDDEESHALNRRVVIQLQ